MDNLYNVLAQPIPLGTILSIVSGLCLAIWGFITNRATERKRYTYDVMMRYANSSEILRAMNDVNRQMSEGQTRGVQTSDGQSVITDAAREQSMALLLPYFQSIALAANQGMLDRNILVIARYGSMKAVFEHFRADIERRRVALDRPLLYIDLEMYLSENEKRYNAYQRRMMGTRPAFAQYSIAARD